MKDISCAVGVTLDRWFWALADGDRVLGSGSVPVAGRPKEEVEVMVAMEVVRGLGGLEYATLSVHQQGVRRLLHEAAGQVGDGRVLLRSALVAGPGRQLAWDRVNDLSGFTGCSQPVPAPKAPEVLTIATDASKNRSDRLCGLGFVTAHGMFGTDTVRCADIDTAELCAIDFALNRVLGRAHQPRTVRVAVDSRHALGMVRGQRKDFHQADWGLCVQALQRIGRMRERHDIEFTWVKGHAGHGLNEVADRLSLQARRAVQMRTPPAVAREIFSRIAAEATQAA